MMDDLLNKAVEEISSNHRKIIDDWCKAYMAELYEAGVDIKPGCFTLCEQIPTYHQGQDCMVKKYWFESGKPEFENAALAMEWKNVKDDQPKYGDKVLAYIKSDKQAIYNMRHDGYFRDTIYSCRYEKPGFIIESHGPILPATHWMVSPDLIEND